MARNVDGVQVEKPCPSSPYPRKYSEGRHRCVHPEVSRPHLLPFPSLPASQKQPKGLSPPRGQNCLIPSLPCLESSHGSSQPFSKRLRPSPCLQGVLVSQLPVLHPPPTPGPPTDSTLQPLRFWQCEALSHPGP